MNHPTPFGPLGMARRSFMRVKLAADHCRPRLARTRAAPARPAILPALSLVLALAMAQPGFACDAARTVQGAAGAGFAAVLLADGSVWLERGPVAEPRRRLARVALLHNIVQLAASGPHLYARQSDGRVWQWQPAEAALPRPVRGLPGKATELATGADGRLLVHVRMVAWPLDGRPPTERQVALRLVEPARCCRPG